ncbi:MAG: hypothetical protein DRO46_01340 [Candidatus Hecatellales archaeon]|nr:MAG: hypothetical protein DRO46_01340 [Candidatus Hecatellales archaeon]
MSRATEQLLGSYYCRLALLLCQHAREHLYSGNCEEASKLCKLISTLCLKNGYPQCLEESKLCLQASKHCKAGKLEEAKSVCEIARKLCPKSFNIYGG